MLKEAANFINQALKIVEEISFILNKFLDSSLNFKWISWFEKEDIEIEVVSKIKPKIVMEKLNQSNTFNPKIPSKFLRVRRKLTIVTWSYILILCFHFSRKNKVFPAS